MNGHESMLVYMMDCIHKMGGGGTHLAYRALAINELRRLRKPRRQFMQAGPLTVLVSGQNFNKNQDIGIA